MMQTIITNFDSGGVVAHLCKRQDSKGPLKCVAGTTCLSHTVHQTLQETTGVPGPQSNSHGSMRTVESLRSFQGNLFISVTGMRWLSPIADKTERRLKQKCSKVFLILLLQLIAFYICLLCDCIFRGIIRFPWRRHGVVKPLPMAAGIPGNPKSLNRVW